LPRCENLSPKEKKKNRQNVLISFISVAKMWKFVKKKKRKHPQNVPISFICVAKMLKICHKEKNKCGANCSHFNLFLWLRCENLWQKENTTKSSIFRERQRDPFFFFLKCNLPWTVPLVLDLQWNKRAYGLLFCMILWDFQHN
jgi:hypothetical protein